MTSRKYKQVRKSCNLYGLSFDTFFKKVNQCLDSDKFTAEQIATIVELCHSCYLEGYRDR